MNCVIDSTLPPKVKTFRPNQFDRQDPDGDTNLMKVMTDLVHAIRQQRCLGLV